MRITPLLLLCGALFSISSIAQSNLPDSVAGSPQPRSVAYAAVQKRLQQGWNTWDTTTIAGEVLLPEGLEVRLGLKRNRTLTGDLFLPSMLIGRHNRNEEQVKPGPHSYDGSYSSFEAVWSGVKLRVEAGHADGDLVMLVTPLERSVSDHLPLTAIFSVGYLWNLPGYVEHQGDRVVGTSAGHQINVYLAGKEANDPYTTLQAPYFAADLTAPVGISTGKPRTVDQIRQILGRRAEALAASHRKGDAQVAPVLDAIETTIAWDTIYEPHGKRVISPVSRLWNVNWGGYVLFDWDTFFAADLAAAGSRDLAYANALEILNEMTPDGFVPNYGRAGGWRSFDRSEPPVGSICVLSLYRQYHDKWLLEDSFDRLLRWNRWWTKHRDLQGYLVWGTEGKTEPENLDDDSRGTAQAAKFESGIDNGPQFDDAYFNPRTHLMELADVGLMGTYIADANALAVIADILGRAADAEWLRASANKYRQSLATLWDPASGIYLNKDLHTGMYSHRLAPTNFYPLLAGAASPQQADEMIRRHLLNLDEFWGQRVLPAIARNDPAFKDQEYWRGRIWGPMNYLVYEGLRNYDTPTAIEARGQLADKSFDLFLIEWNRNGHVHENYSATLDDSDTVSSSDRFYHWGALLGLMKYEELTQLLR